MRLAGSRGQALTEFIIIVPLFLALLLGVVQLGLLFFAYQTVHYAAFAACRAAVVRPCMAFHPDNAEFQCVPPWETAPRSCFTPTVFTAAVLATMVAMPSIDLFGTKPADYYWMPDPPATGPVTGLDFDNRDANIYIHKYVNAAYLTAVRRVWASIPDPPAIPDWQPTADGAGPGLPCMDDSGTELSPAQNVPPTGDDISLEVIVLYPMSIPFVNRLFYGVFINFSEFADDLSIPEILGPSGDPEDVMLRPTKVVPLPGAYQSNLGTAVGLMRSRYGYSQVSAGGQIQSALINQAWYPLPIRARATLTVEGSVFPMMYP